MAESTYKIIELVGTSDTSWEEAARTAVETAGESLRDLRIAEITKLDLTIENGKVKSYRARVNISFKYKKGDLMAKERTFLDTKQLAQRWKRSPRTVEGWRTRKIGPDYLDLNGKIVYDLEEIIRAEEEARVSHETRQT